MYHSLLITLLQHVAPHVKIVNLSLALHALSHRKIEWDCLSFLGQLNTRVKRWNKLVDLRLPVVSGSGLNQVRKILTRVPRLRTLVLRPLEVDFDPIVRTTNASTEPAKLDLPNLTSMAIVTLPRTQTAFHIALPIRSVTKYHFMDILCDILTEINQTLLVQAPSLEKLFISQRAPTRPSKLEGVLKGLSKLKALYIDGMTPYGSKELLPINSRIETLWLGLDHNVPTVSALW